MTTDRYDEIYRIQFAVSTGNECLLSAKFAKMRLFLISLFGVLEINHIISITYGRNKIGTFDAEVLCKK